MQHYRLFEYINIIVYLFFQIMVSINKKTSFYLIFLIFLTSSCGDTGLLKKPDWSKPSIDGKELARKNVREGKGITIIPEKNKGGDFLFASSNPMWRASLETIDFMPLLTVDYAGGLIITDWYSDGSTNESIKITIRFLDTEVRVDAMIIDIHKKVCNNTNNCKIDKIDTKLNFQIRDKILKKAAVYASDLKTRTIKNRPKKVYPGDDGPSSE